MKRMALLVTALIAVCAPLLAQNVDPEFDALHKSEMARYSALARFRERTSAIDRVIDVNYYKLNIRIANERNVLSGDVTAIARVTAPSITAVEYDLTNTMIVDSALVDGIVSAVTATPSSIRIAAPRTYHAGDLITTHIFYHGNPVHSGFGSYTDSTGGGARWIFTLSEPYGARDWWPCIDQPSDKADSVDIWITCNKTLRAVTNGKLIATVQNLDGTKTYQWKHRYPISTYLIPITIGNFNRFSYWYKYSAVDSHIDSMEIVNYVLPGIDSTSPAYLENTALTPKMMGIYASLFGQYPFIREKYGHVQFGWGGGMEHQTLTSLGSNAFYETTIAHELAHQWFGDMITCRTWPDLWLNEGFAQYCESVYREKAYGPAAYMLSLLSRIDDAKRAVGTLYVQDTSTVTNLFASSRVYNKGSWVLHMLRHTVGDSLFFASLRAYATTPALMYSTASTSDLRAVFERTTGRDLGWFFNEWVFGETYPSYSVRYSSTPVTQGAGSTTTVSISQTTGTLNPVFFKMPVDLQFFAAGWDTTVTVMNDANPQLFMMSTSHRPDSVRFDPGSWILKDATVGRLVSVRAETSPVAWFLTQNYPNPFNPSTVIRFGVEEECDVSIKIYDIMGREAATVFEGKKAAGEYAVPVNAAAFASGVYLYRMTARNGSSVYSATKKLVIIK
jgi:aminopeptidase N